MIWQDLVFGAGQFVFAIALIPALRSATKPPRVTCVLTGGVLCAFAFTFATLALTYSAATSLGCGAMWLALAAQRRATETKHAEHERHPHEGRVSGYQPLPRSGPPSKPLPPPKRI